MPPEINRPHLSHLADPTQLGLTGAADAAAAATHAAAWSNYNSAAAASASTAAYASYLGQTAATGFNSATAALSYGSTAATAATVASGGGISPGDDGGGAGEEVNAAAADNSQLPTGKIPIGQNIPSDTHQAGNEPSFLLTILRYCLVRRSYTVPLAELTDLSMKHY